MIILIIASLLQVDRSILERYINCDDGDPCNTGIQHVAACHISESEVSNCNNVIMENDQSRSDGSWPNVLHTVKHLKRDTNPLFSPGSPSTE